MDVTPNDIRNYEFANQMRGYDKEEVDNLLDQVADALESAKQVNLKHSMESDSLRTQLAGLRQFEDTIKSAAIDARRNADMTIATAKKEAEQIVKNAQGEAERHVDKRVKMSEEIEEQIAKLELTRRSYLAKLKNMISSHLDTIDEISSDQSATTAPQSQKVEVTRSTEIEDSARVAIATEPSPVIPTKTEEARIAAPPPTRTPAPAPAPPQKPVPENASNAKSEGAGALQDYNPPAESAPATGKWVETDQRADDIPPGFVAKTDDPVPAKDNKEIDTDKVGVETNGNNEPVEKTEHNAIRMDDTESSRGGDTYRFQRRRRNESELCRRRYYANQRSYQFLPRQSSHRPQRREVGRPFSRYV